MQGSGVMPSNRIWDVEQCNSNSILANISLLIHTFLPDSTIEYEVIQGSGTRGRNPRFGFYILKKIYKTIFDGCLNLNLKKQLENTSI